MKSAVKILSLLFLIVSCSKSSKIQSDIKGYLIENAPYPINNYEILKYEIIDTITNGMLNEFEKYNEKYGYLRYNEVREVPAISPETVLDSVMLNEIRATQNFEDEILTYNNSIEGKKVLGYIIDQKFRLRKKQGDYEIIKMEFAIDNDFNFIGKMDGDLKIFKKTID